MIIKMAVADKNVEYVERILSVLEGYEDLSLSVYTEKGALEQALAVRNFDVLLFDCSVYEGQVQLRDSTLAVMLLDESVSVPETCRDFRKIHKYQRISRIYQQVLSLYAEICDDAGSVVGQGGTISIAYYSPVGGAGKTTLALAAATRLAMQGSRVLYLNLEEIASEDCYLPQNAKKGLSELVTCLGQKMNFSMKIQGLLQSKIEGLFYLNHFDSPNDIYELTGEEVTELLEQFSRSGLFDVLVLDLGIVLDTKLLHVFEFADKILLVEKADAIAVRKMGTFLAQAHIINEYGRKMYRVLNFDMGRGSAIQTQIPLIGKVNTVQNPDAAQLVSMLAKDSCSNYLSQLTGGVRN